MSLEIASGNADLLRLLSGAEPIPSIAELARLLGRDKGNTHKTLARLEQAGIVAKCDGLPLPALTEAGQRALQAIAFAEGGEGLPAETSAGATRWPFDDIERNPLNPRKHYDEEKLRGLADSIEADGDIIVPLVLFPADQNGARMLFAGERRHRAVEILKAEGRLPAALEAGLPFVERQVEESDRVAQSALVALIENGQRENLTPWEEAKALLALQQATGLSAREIAKRAGYAPEGTDTGVRAVQEKIKTAKDAKPEDVALVEAGERDYAWLREQCREKVVLDPAAAAKAERRALHRAKLDTLTPRELLPLIELADKCWREPAESGGQREHAAVIERDKVPTRFQELFVELGGFFVHRQGECVAILHDDVLVWLAERGQLTAPGDDSAMKAARVTVDAVRSPNHAAYATRWLNTAAPEQTDIEEAVAAASPRSAADVCVPAGWKATDLKEATAWLDGATIESLEFEQGKVRSQGGVRAKIELARIRNTTAWVVTISVEMHSSGSGGPALGLWSASQKVLPSRVAAIREAVRRLKARIAHDGGSPPAKYVAWLDALAVDDRIVFGGQVYPNVTRANEARLAAEGGVHISSPGKPAAAGATDEGRTAAAMPPALALCLAEIGHATSRISTRTWPTPAGDQPCAMVGDYWRSQEASDLQSDGLVAFHMDKEGAGWLVYPTDAGKMAIASQPWGMDGGYVPDAQLTVLQGDYFGADEAAWETFRDSGKRYVFDFLNDENVQAARAPGAPPPTVEPDAGDPQEAEDAVTLQDVKSFLSNPEWEVGDGFRELLARLGVDHTLAADTGENAGGVFCSLEEVCTVDVNRENSDPRAEALARLIAAALNRCAEL